jgi:hypothetical protein
MKGEFICNHVFLSFMEPVFMILSKCWNVLDKMFFRYGGGSGRYGPDRNGGDRYSGRSRDGGGPRGGGGGDRYGGGRDRSGPYGRPR